jgi:uncharacterized DUF497 family protein
MDIDQYLDPEFDFSRLTPEDFLGLENVKFDDIVQVYSNPRTRLYDHSNPFQSDRWECIGFSKQSQCLQVIFDFTDDHKISFILIKLSNEYDIKQYWCRRLRRI